MFNAGEAYNVIPDRATLAGTVRAFSEPVAARIEARLRELCAGVAAGFGVEVGFDSGWRSASTIAAAIRRR